MIFNSTMETMRVSNPSDHSVYGRDAHTYHLSVSVRSVPSIMVRPLLPLVSYSDYHNIVVIMRFSCSTKDNSGVHFEQK